MNDKKFAKERRIFELSQVGEVPTELSYQIPFRHLCNLLQIHSGNIDNVIASLEGITPSQEERLRQRCICAWNWISEFSPEDFRWVLSTPDQAKQVVEGPMLAALVDLHSVVGRLDDYDEKALAEEIYAIAARNEVAPPELFKVVYGVLIDRERGPKLAGFIKTCGKDKILPILQRYL